MPRAATRTLRASRRTGSTAPASTAWSNASRALCWAPASMPQHRARAHAAHPGAAPARLQSGTLTIAQPPTSARSCTAQRSSSGASPCCRSFVQCSVRAAQRQADPWHAWAAVGRRPAERVRAASAAMSPAAASERRKEAASRMLFRNGLTYSPAVCFLSFFWRRGPSSPPSPPSFLAFYLFLHRTKSNHFSSFNSGCDPLSELIEVDGLWTRAGYS